MPTSRARKSQPDADICASRAVATGGHILRPFTTRPYSPGLKATWAGCTVTAMELNAHRLVITGEVEFATIAKPEGLERRDMERRLGCALREHDGLLWAARALEERSAEPVRVKVTACTPWLLDFAIREVLAARLEQLGASTWFSRGVVNAVGLLGSKAVDQFLIEPRLMLGVTSDYGDAGSLLIASARHRWSCRAPLADAEMIRVAPGRRAVRRRGNGPKAGVIERVGNETALLSAGGEPVEVPAADYALLANSALVAQLSGSKGLAAVREASGETTRTRKKNTYAVKDRFALAARMLEQLGGEVALPGGVGNVRISPERAQVHMEGAA